VKKAVSDENCSIKLEALWRPGKHPVSLGLVELSGEGCLDGIRPSSGDWLANAALLGLELVYKKLH
jgi:hypothetical protein